MIRIALAGNPNCGKTTLFNALTGSNQFVGNWPGVTVEKKEGPYRNNKEVTITDLPGIYSLSPYTLEEVVARNYLINDHPDAILNIVDGTNLERNLYLTTQLSELGIPMVVAVNMMDIVAKNGDSIDIKRLSKELGCPVIEISALKKTGIDAAVLSAVDAVNRGAKGKTTHSFSGCVEHAIAHIEEAVLHNMPEEKQRWYAIKLFERDEKVREILNLKKEILDHIDNDIKECEKELDDDAEAIIANERYTYVASIIGGCCKKKNRGQLGTSDKIDRIVTNRFLALPIFALVMYLVYYVSVTTVGTYVTDWTNDGLFGDGFSLFGTETWIPGIPVIAEAALDAIGCADWLKGLVIDGIIGGVGAVLGFVPQMLVLFLFLAWLEACGYMARIAFIMDRIFRKFGLSGKSFIPMLIGTGCGVPGVMASRTIESDRDRKMTIITTTFIPCGAKLPIIALVTSALFNDAAWVAPSAYFLGMAAIVFSGIILKKTRLFAGNPSPFVMELPAYHLPTAGNVLRSMWERGWSFIKKAGTIILVASIVIWVGSVFGWTDGRFGFNPDMELSDSILGLIGDSLKWIFAPLGFGDATAVVATIMGLVAKEEVVAVFGVLDFQGLGSPLAGYSFLAFNLLCAPCFAAMGAIRREMNNGRWTAIAITYQCVAAYLVSLIIYQLGSAFSGSFDIGTVFGLAALGLIIYLVARPDRVYK